MSAPCNCGMFVGAEAPRLPLSDRFFAQLAAMGQRRRTDPAVYLNVWCAESRLNPAAVNPAGGAQGLNQMMPRTLANLGAPADFARLSGEEQLPWIEILIAEGERLNGGPFESAARYYHSNFFPRTMKRGKSLGTVVAAGDAADPEERGAYLANRSLDPHGRGRIMLGDLADVLASVRTSSSACREGMTRLAQAVRALPPPGITWSVGGGGSKRAPNALLVGGIFVAALAGVVAVAAWGSRS